MSTNPAVETVRGRVPVGELGPTLMHEHIFVITTDMHENYSIDWDETAQVQGAVGRLEELRSRGISTIVDPTVVGLGRNVERIQRVAASTGLNIIVATGLYTFDSLPHYFDYRGGPGTLLGGPEPMVELFVKDITDGIANTGVRAGILKCATDSAGLTPGVERVLRSVARAHRATGVPITTHTDSHTHRGIDQIQVFDEEGVDLSRVVIGHCGDTTDLSYLTTLLGRGCLIGMDRFGLDSSLAFEERVDVVARLCAAGYSGQMVLSHDAACYIDWLEDRVRSTFLPKWNYNHISDDVLPALQERGVTEDQIAQMLVVNPRELFASAALGPY